MLTYSKKYILHLLIAGVMLAVLLSACGDATSTQPPATTAATTATSTTVASTTAVAITTAVTAALTTVAATMTAATSPTTSAAGATTAAAVAGGTIAPAFDLKVPDGTPLSKADMAKFASVFSDKPLTGTQTAPFIARFVNKNVFIFMQFDKSAVADATSVRYVGMGLKGVFCSEAQPGGAKGGFSHFQRYNAESYEAGGGGPQGSQGYWLLFIGADEFDGPNGHVSPGIDYNYLPTPAPTCGANVPAVNFNPEGAVDQPKDKLVGLASLFNDKPFIGGQTPPRLSKFLNKDIFFFGQFDKSVAADVTILRDIGIGKRSQFCQQPTADFSHFHRYSAPSYAAGHGGLPTSQGYWMSFTAVMEMESGGATILPGPDRNFSKLEAPASCEATPGLAVNLGKGAQATIQAQGSASGQIQEIKLITQLSDSKAPFIFSPANLTIKAGTTVRWVNADNVFHTITSTDSLDKKQPNGLFDKAVAANGDKFEYTFDKPGTYNFYCQTHASFMFGTIKVEA